MIDFTVFNSNPIDKLDGQVLCKRKRVSLFHKSKQVNRVPLDGHQGDFENPGSEAKTP